MNERELIIEEILERYGYKNYWLIDRINKLVELSK